MAGLRPTHPHHYLCGDSEMRMYAICFVEEYICSFVFFEDDGDVLLRLRNCSLLLYSNVENVSVDFIEDMAQPLTLITMLYIVAKLP